MRRIYLLVLFWSILSAAMAQTGPPVPDVAPPPPPPEQTQYTRDVDFAFANLDKNGITSGILYDRVFSAANLRESGEPSSAGHFQQAYSELYQANYNPYTYLSRQDLSNLVWENEQRGVVTIGVVLANFQTVNPDAIELDNNQYRLRAGYNNGQLYQTSQAVVASVLSTSIGYTATKFQLPMWAIYTNNNLSISSVTVDFGENNQIKTFTPGNAIVDVFFVSLGEKTIRYTINLSDGSQRTAVSMLTIGDSSSGVVYDSATNGVIPNPVEGGAITNYMEPPSRDGFGNIERLAIESDDTFQGYDEASPTKGKGNAYFYYAEGRNGNNLRKPVIIVDGFDAGDERGPNELYRVRLRYLDQAGQEKFLGNELREDDPSYQSRPDYNSDLVLLNFPKYESGFIMGPGNIRVPIVRDGGVDYIERNALVLVKLINIVNERLRLTGSTEKITLIGPSMGGLISRYALRYMELRGMNANCKLWVSFDSPHNGANIPIGGQHFLNFFGNELGIVSAREALNSQVNSPASKQLLLHHYSNGEAAGGAPGFRDRFVSTLNSFGYPQAACLRKVALVNGSKNGTLQPFGACQEALYLKGRLTNLSTVLCNFFGLGIVCAVGRDRVVEARAYTVPSGSNRCLALRANITSFSLGGPYEKYAIGRGNNQPGNDVQPGSYYKVLDEIAGKARTKNWFYRIDVSTGFPQATFVPTVSSYALYNTDRNWGASLNGVNIPAETPFAAIYAPDINQEHVELTQAGVEFVRTQIGEANQQCVQPPAGGSLTPGCYVIKSQKTGQSLQAMSDGFIKQQGNNGQNNQIWKAEDVGGGQFRFTTQNGTNQVIKADNGNNVGEVLTLGGYNGDDRQKWSVAQNGSSGNYRVYRSNGLTWDMKDYGNSSELQLYGNTSEPFYDYRSFRFDGATCPTGTPPPPPVGGNLTKVNFYFRGDNCQVCEDRCRPGLIQGSNDMTNWTTLFNMNSVVLHGGLNEFPISTNTTWQYLRYQAASDCYGEVTELEFYNGANKLLGTPFGSTDNINGLGYANAFDGDYSSLWHGNSPGTQNYVGIAIGGTPPPPPPPSGFAITGGTLDCGSGDLTVNTTGGNGTTIEYRAVGLRDWGTGNVLNVPAHQRNGTNFTLQARQSGTEVSLNYGTNCAGYRLAAPGSLNQETATDALVLAPNPSKGTVKVRFRLAKQEKATLSVVSLSGQTLQRQAVVGTGNEQTEVMELREAAGLYLIRLQTAQGVVRMGKLVLER